MIKAVVLDVGETLIDETRIWSRWADRLGVSRFVMMGALGGMAALDRSHREAFELVRPGLDLTAELAAWERDEPHSLRNHLRQLRKINVDTDNRLAMTGAIRKVLAEDPEKFDPRDYMKPARAAMKKVCVDRMVAFGQAGNASKMK